jgi:hypothetical protein
MYIVELSYPGMSLDYPDAEAGRVIERLLSSAEAPLAEAALALTWFEAEQRKPFGTEPEAESTTVAPFQAALVAELGPGPYDPSQVLALHSRLELEARRERWKRGILPESYQQHVVFMHAKSFLLALDRIERIFGVLTEIPNIPEDVRRAKQAFDTALPTLRGVRNSVAHHEDRSRGLQKGGKPLDLKPVENQLIRAPGGFLILDSLIGSNFGATMADGEYGEVAVTSATLAAAGRLVQTAIQAFQWKGRPRHWPV